MKHWKFYLTDIELSQTRQLTHPIDEWKSFGISYGREQKTTILKSYAAGFTFIKEDAKYLQDIVFTRGFNVKIKIEIYALAASGNELLQYEGYLNLTDPKITANTFNCPIYEGGFFVALENNLNKQFEIKAFDLDSGNDNADFYDVEFDGAEYEYEEELGLLGDDQEYEDVRVSMKYMMYQSNLYIINFLPIKKVYKRDAKLNFFNSAKALSVQYYSSDPDSDREVTNEQCFIVSPNKVNGGKLHIEFSKIIGDIEIEVPSLITNSSGETLMLMHSSTHPITTRAYIYIYNENPNEKWRINDNLVDKIEKNSSLYCWLESELVSVASNGDETILLKDYHVNLPDEEINLGTYLASGEKAIGYRVAIALDISINLSYLNLTTNGIHYLTPISGTSGYSANYTLIPKSDFKIIYSNDKFMLNKAKTVHAIHPATLFNSLINKFNTHTVSIDTSELGILPVMIASGTTLLGSKQDLIESGIQASVITSIKDFCEFAYKVFALKLYCRYNKANDTYYMSFLKIQDCYPEHTLIQELDAISDLTITADRENLYTSIKAGYQNSQDAIFGQLEYNTTNQYETEITERETNELDLVCKYKGGALDLETYVHEKYRNYDDTQEGSSDVWLLHAKWYSVDGGKYRMEHGSASPKMQNPINTLFTPKRILIRHDNELSSYLYFTQTINLISSERNENFECSVINEYYLAPLINEKDPLTLSGNNYTKPFLLAISIPAVRKIIEAIDQNPLGYFQFKINGKTYKGYIANGRESIQVNPMNEATSTLKLIAHKD